MNIEGTDVDIETSLKEYGIAWVIRDTYILFYYGVLHDGNEFIKFDHRAIKKDIDVRKEYDFVCFPDLYSWLDVSADEWDNLRVEEKICNLVDYHGFEDIFGSTYWAGLDYEEVINS